MERAIGFLLQRNCLLYVVERDKVLVHAREGFSPQVVRLNVFGTVVQESCQTACGLLELALPNQAKSEVHVHFKVGLEDIRVSQVVVAFIAQLGSGI